MATHCRKDLARGRSCRRRDYFSKVARLDRQQRVGQAPLTASSHNDSLSNSSTNSYFSTDLSRTYSKNVSRLIIGTRLVWSKSQTAIASPRWTITIFLSDMVAAPGNLAGTSNKLARPDMSQAWGNWIDGLKMVHLVQLACVSIHGPDEPVTWSRTYMSLEYNHKMVFLLQI